MSNNDTRPPVSDEEFKKSLEEDGERLKNIYLFNKLSPEQIDKAIDNNIYLEVLYPNQELTPDNITHAIENGIDLYALYTSKNKELTPEHINQAIEKGEYLYTLYERQSTEYGQMRPLTKENIDKALDKGIALDVIYRNQKLMFDQIDKAIDKGIKLDTLYRYQKLTPEQIDKAIDKGIALYALYTHQKLSPENIDKAIDKGIEIKYLYLYQTLTPNQIDKAIEEEIRLEYLYEYQTLTPKQIDKAIDKGIKLDTLYRCQKLTPDQIDKAIDKGIYISVLFTYQKNLEPRHIEYAIDHNIALDYLYTLPQLTDDQRKRILAKMGYDIPPEYLDSPLWRYVSPRLLTDAIRFFSESVDNRLDVHPIDDLVGVYPVHNPMNDLENAIYSKGYYLKEGDFDYAYYTDKDGRERQIRIGRALKDNPDLIDLYRAIKPILTEIYQESHSLKILDEPLEIVISNDPVDIARKSTGQSWSSCEAIGDSWGWPTKDGCGWCNDIKANNLIAYIRKVGSDKWIGRKMIRWCIRSDDQKPDVVAEPYYGDIRYMPIMDYELMNIIRSKGYSGSGGTVSCATPYEYSGYSDEVHRGRASFSDSHIVYRVGERGIRSEEEDGERIYRPKVLK